MLQTMLFSPVVLMSNHDNTSSVLVLVSTFVLIFIFPIPTQVRAPCCLLNNTARHGCYISLDWNLEIPLESMPVPGPGNCLAITELTSCCSTLASVQTLLQNVTRGFGSFFVHVQISVTSIKVSSLTM